MCCTCIMTNKKEVDKKKSLYIKITKVCAITLLQKDKNPQY